MPKLSEIWDGSEHELEPNPNGARLVVSSTVEKAQDDLGPYELAEIEVVTKPTGLFTTEPTELRKKEQAWGAFCTALRSVAEAMQIQIEMHQSNFRDSKTSAINKTTFVFKSKTSLSERI